MSEWPSRLRVGTIHWDDKKAKQNVRVRQIFCQNFQQRPEKAISGPWADVFHLYSSTYMVNRRHRRKSRPRVPPPDSIPLLPWGSAPPSRSARHIAIHAKGMSQPPLPADHPPAPLPRGGTRYSSRGIALPRGPAPPPSPPPH